jgi:hypothetical protein
LRRLGLDGIDAAIERSELLRDDGADALETIERMFASVGDETQAGGSLRGTANLSIIDVCLRSRC